MVELGAGDKLKLTYRLSRAFNFLLLADIAEPAVIQAREFLAVCLPPAHRGLQFSLSDGTCSARTHLTIMWMQAWAVVAAHRQNHLPTLESALMCLFSTFPPFLLTTLPPLPACSSAPSTCAEWAQTPPSTALIERETGRI